MIELIRAHILPAALSLLPPSMDTPDARRLILAIGLQESRFEHRRQVSGPARGYFEFERGGVMGLIRHPATQPHLQAAVLALKYDPEMASDDIGLHAAIEHNDMLACVLARLNLWWLPGAPAATQDDGWNQYVAAWKPGKPRPETWADCWAQAA